MSDRWATFDCYGTLIDWDAGLREAFASLWPHANSERLLDLHHTVEPHVQAHGGLPYAEVLSRCLRAVAAIEGLQIPAGRERALADSLSSWPPFGEVGAALAELRERGWRLAILSNTDPELLAASVESIGVPFDILITAADAGSYKPAPGHWQRFRAEAGADPARHAHVAASLFHDIRPAAELGVTAVWVNRLGESSDVPRAAELPDLRDVPRVLDGLS